MWPPPLNHYIVTWSMHGHSSSVLPRVPTMTNLMLNTVLFAMEAPNPPSAQATVRVGLREAPQAKTGALYRSKTNEETPSAKGKLVLNVIARLNETVWPQQFFPSYRMRLLQGRLGDEPFQRVVLPETHRHAVLPTSHYPILIFTSV